jgi:hypothetical protein
MVLVLNDKKNMKKFYFILCCIFLLSNAPVFAQASTMAATDASLFEKPVIDFKELDKLEAALVQNPDLDIKAYAASTSDLHLNLNPTSLASKGIKPFWIGCFFNVFGYFYVGQNDKYSTEEKWQSLFGCMVNGATCVAGVLILVWR